MAEIIYNVTTKVLHEVAVAWLDWMKEEHIPAMISTGCFQKSIILRLKGVDDTEGPTYAVQYFAANQQDYDRYLAEFATELRAAALERWGNKIVSFRTVLEVVN